MSTNLEAESGRYTVLPTNLPTSDRFSVLLVARHPGAANCLAPVGHLLNDRGYGVAFRTVAEGERIVNFGFEDRQEIDTDSLPENLRWTLISGDSPNDFEIKTLLKIKEKRLRSKIGIVEDYPGSIDGLIQDLIKNSLHPDLILTTTRGQAGVYREKYPLLEKCMIVPIGQPSFDSLLAEDTLAQSKAARVRLGIPAETKLVTYIGLPAQDVSSDEINFQPYDDFNSYILVKVAKSMVDISSKYPRNQFGLINRPHPREADALWEHPELTKITKLPENLIFFSPSKEYWQQLGLTTRQVCTASDLVTTVISTVGQETALSGSRPKNKTKLGSLALHILPEDARNFWIPGGFPLAEIGATGFAGSIDETQSEIERCLFDEIYQNQIKHGQAELLHDYRFNAPATPRVITWMRVVDQHNFSA